ncbi:MAG: PQQ-binding-like beta-propeller repeat protein [Pirellulales bacterium]|nr:PQQ-binding-like beta-propeller repeat protein [Pirellulales bacterium]
MTAFATVVLVASPAVAQLVAQPINPPKAAPDAQEMVSGVYLPSDRALSRAMGRAKERLANREYHEALQFLHEIMSRNEDSFLDREGSEKDQPGLKITARRLIGSLPSEGRQAYEVLFGPMARRQLQTALRQGNYRELAGVVRQYYHTTAGYEATWMLAQMESDLGHYLGAAQLYQDLMNTPQAAGRFEPQLSVAAAVNLLMAGKADEANRTVQAIARTRPDAKVRIRGEEVSLKEAAEKTFSELVTELRASTKVAASTEEWLMFRGGPSRQVDLSGGRPHLRPRWEARVVNDPSVEAFLVGRASDFQQRGVAAVPSARPIALGNLIVMRTPTNLVAIDWSTGKRLWETRDEQELSEEDTLSELPMDRDEDQLAAQGRPLEDRVWFDALSASLSSDGNRVYAVRGGDSWEDDSDFQWQQANIVLGRRVMGRQGGMMQATVTNRLTAYEVASEGKLAWELDGERGGGAIAGAFFLGAPLAIDGTLYALTEVNSSVYLVAIEPTTGKMLWQQQLLGLEQGIGFDLGRRRAGAMPSYSGGILVCPTGASAAIGVDVVRRELAWVYRYPRETQSPYEARNQFQQQQLQESLLKPNDRWLENTALIADGRVLITPPESSELHCIDLETGKEHWKRRRGEMIFLGFVEGDVVLLVGTRSFESVSLTSGAPAWKQESIPLPEGIHPSGLGYASEGRYYLPLTSGQVASVDLATGELEIEKPLTGNLSLGNLICFRGSVVSQSPLSLGKFEQLAFLEKRAETNLANNPNNVDALRELAEIKESSGDRVTAIRLLKQALARSPEDAATQEMYVQVVLEAMASDFDAYQSEISVLSRLTRSREQQVELLRIQAEGREIRGERLAAWEAYLRLADFSREQPELLRLKDSYSVRSDRWISSRLSELWREASAEERREFNRQLEDRRSRLGPSPTVADMRYFLAHFELLPGVEELRMVLAKELIERNRSAEAEIELLRLASSLEPAVQATAREILEKSGMETRPFVGGQGARVAWPRGQVETRVLPMIEGNDERNRQEERFQATSRVYQRGNGYRQIRVEQNYLGLGEENQWFLSSDNTEIICRNGLGEDLIHFAIDQRHLSRQMMSDPGWMYCAQLGHLQFFAMGGRVVALDTRLKMAQLEGNQLWPTSSTEDFAADTARLRRKLSTRVQRANRPPVYHAYSGRKRFSGTAVSLGGSLGPVSPRGVVFQDQDELKCVDPLTGVVLWSRSDIPIGCEVFGDDEIVLAADVGNHEVYVVSQNDGRLLGKRELPPGEWLITAGRNLAQLQINNVGSSRSATVRITDLWAQATLFEEQLPTTARFSVIEPNLIAIVEATGVFRLIDVVTGKAVADQQLLPAADMQSIYTLRAGESLYLFITGQPLAQYRPIGQPTEFPIINGLVYAFSLETGKPIWPGPALVRNRGIVLQQPNGIPLLVFAEHCLVRDATNGGGAQLRLLCLDRRTGQTVYRENNLPGTSITRFRIRGEWDAQPKVAVDVTSGTLELLVTDRPRPPQPPSNDDLEATRQVSERGLRGLGERLGNALRGAVENPNAAPGPQRVPFGQGGLEAGKPAAAPPAAPPVPQPTEKDLFDDD